MTRKWVATGTGLGSRGELIEEGRVYAERFGGPVRRPLVEGERLVTCPQCGEQFADTDDGPAEAHRDMHMTGDEDSPSICAGHEPQSVPEVLGSAPTRTR